MIDKMEEPRLYPPMLGTITADHDIFQTPLPASVYVEISETDSNQLAVEEASQPDQEQFISAQYKKTISKKFRPLPNNHGEN